MAGRRRTKSEKALEWFAQCPGCTEDLVRDFVARAHKYIVRRADWDKQSDEFLVSTDHPAVVSLVRAFLDHRADDMLVDPSDLTRRVQGQLDRLLRRFVDWEHGLKRGDAYPASKREERARARTTMAIRVLRSRWPRSRRGVRGLRVFNANVIGQLLRGPKP